MRHCQWSSLYTTHTKAWHVTIMDSFIQHSLKGFHNQDKQQRGQWVILSQPPKTLKKPTRRVIYQNREVNYRHTKENPLPPSSREATYSSNCIRNPQFTLSKAFSTSNLQSSPDKPVFNLLSRHSLAISTASRIYRFLTKALCEVEIISSMTMRSLLAKTLAMIL